MSDIYPIHVEFFIGNRRTPDLIHSLYYLPRIGEIVHEGDYEYEVTQVVHFMPTENNREQSAVISLKKIE